MEVPANWLLAFASVWESLGKWERGEREICLVALSPP